MRTERTQPPVALVTGASMGLGRALAAELSRAGYRVYGTSRRGKDPLHAQGSGTELLYLDVTREPSIHDCLQYILSREHRLDLLVNNAGYSIYGEIGETTAEYVCSQFDTNFFGVHRVILEVLPVMRQQGQGLIVNIGSLAGRTFLPKKYFYSASKAALAMYTDGLQFELAGSGIAVVLVEPGFLETEFSRNTVAVSPAAAGQRRARQAKSTNRRADGKRSPEKAARAILRIIANKHRRRRYLLGAGAVLLCGLTTLLPAGLQHRLKKRML